MLLTISGIAAMRQRRGAGMPCRYCCFDVMPRYSAARDGDADMMLLYLLIFAARYTAATRMLSLLLKIPRPRYTAHERYYLRAAISHVAECYAKIILFFIFHFQRLCAYVVHICCLRADVACRAASRQGR